MTDELIENPLNYEIEEDGYNFYLILIYNNTKYQFVVRKENGEATFRIDDDDFDDDCHDLAVVDLKLMSKLVNLSKAVKQIKG